ncbi:MAG: acyltransferase domain-containing protein [Planctomycetota bacterium]|nr:acyltransferase domain-containing protein [Planctomycetota bacterium]
MELKNVLAALGEEDCLEAVSPYWEESEACFPKELPPFLQPERIKESRKWCLLAEYDEPKILETAKRVAEDENLLHLAWHCYRLTFHYPKFLALSGFPSLEKSLGKDMKGLFYLLVDMELAPFLRDLHKRMGVDEAVTRNNLTQIRDMNWGYRKSNEGRPGSGLSYWLKHHTNGELFRIGRMQYFIKPSFGFVEAYRNRETGEVVSVAEDGLTMTDDGFMTFEGEEKTATWITEHVTDYQAGTTTGNVILPDKGITLKQKITLDLNVWRHVLGKGSLMLSMHIPGGGTMALKKCIESARDAFVFFEKHFPHRPVVGIDCISWIFGPQLEDMFEADSNLVELMRIGYLYPTPRPRYDSLGFIFYRNDNDFKNYPRNNELQSTVLDWVLADKPWHVGGWFVLKDDIEQIGLDFYRSKFPPKGVKID